ncbi:MAG TPA: signal peptide peptidase SppA, partial [Rhizobiales bacterium]|nr:signal peptide peptidase SppA [Hyphomicrobiales bacterium]
MKTEARILLERRRLKRRLSVWRITAVIALLLALGALVLKGDEDLGTPGGTHIARMSLSGFITDDRKQQDLLAKIAKAKRVKALILRINSGGGTTTGSEALFEAIRKVAKEKPVVAVLGTVAASGAYVAAISTDYIVARGNTITGSIGVIVQWPEIAGVLEKIGVKYREVKSSPLKASPSPFLVPDPKSMEITRAMVRDSYEWFRDLVAERRGLDADRAARLADGRIYTGRQALKEGLVDAIGGEDKAREWLTKERKIDAELKVK